MDGTKYGDGDEVKGRRPTTEAKADLDGWGMQFQGTYQNTETQLLCYQVTAHGTARGGSLKSSKVAA